jgi:hypothetical protein
MYMAVVSVAIVLSFHLKNQPSDVELQMARPLGMIFGALSWACLGLGLSNYISPSFAGVPAVTSGAWPSSFRWLLTCRAVTVNKYSTGTAIVQAGWKTQVVRVDG